jgi:cyanophycinase
MTENAMAKPLFRAAPKSLQRCALILALAIAAEVMAAAATGGKGGYLVIVGGGDRPKSVTDRFIKLAGGPESAHLVVIPLASEDAAGTGQHSMEQFKAAGVQHVEVLPTAGEAAVVLLRQATAIWFSGGDQVKLTRALEGTPIVGAVREVWRRGGVIGGTSAGAAIMSAVMITGEERGLPREEDRFRSIQQGRIETSAGFGFITNAIVDQHFIARKRSNRLLTVVLENPRLLGIGIDESTAVVVGPDQKFEVIGKSSVMVVNGRQARNVHASADGHLGAEDLRIHILVEGDKFDLRKGRPCR